MTARKSANQHLRMLLAEADWTGQQLARAVNAVAAENGVRVQYDRTSVAHWLSGSMPRPRVRPLAAEAFSRRLRRTITLLDLGWAADTQSADPDEQQHWPSDSVTRLAHLCKADADPVQGPRLHWSVYQAGEAAVPRQRTPPFTVGTSRTELVPAAAELASTVLAAGIPFFSRALEVGGSHARAALAAYLGNDVSLWLQATASCAGCGVLPSETARLLYLLARMHIDDAHEGLAQQYFRIAFDLVGAAGDTTTQAIVLRAMSSQAGALRHIRQSLIMAEQAFTLVPEDAPHGVHAFVGSQLAVARALAGQPFAARTALLRAETHHRHDMETDNSNAAHDAPAGFHTYGAAAWHFQRGRTLAVLGERSAAAAAFRTSLAHRHPRSHRARALTLAALTQLLLQAGHVEEACASYRELLDLDPHPRSARTQQAVVDLKRRLRPFSNSRAVKSLLDQLDQAERHTTVERSRRLA
ncbi:hypothetical protein AB0G64_36890 [Streptomyces longwoodensis]|uniref:hypothetical protein n=1 Tax=Streptomyces longwoodensis TaxID=68231 RepID=UPI00340C3767